MLSLHAVHGDAQQRIRGKCPLGLASYDVSTLLTADPVSQLPVPPIHARSVAESLAWLPRLQRAVVPDLETLSPPQNSLGDDAPQSLAKTVSLPVPLPSGTTIHAWCASQSPFEVIGRYVALDRRGLGSCPFGEHHSDGKDSHPSFRVYYPKRAGGSCWYCYVWEHGGNLFDFLCYWHDISAKMLWHRILTGEVF